MGPHPLTLLQKNLLEILNASKKTTNHSGPEIYTLPNLVPPTSQPALPPHFFPFLPVQPALCLSGETAGVTLCPGSAMPICALDVGGKSPDLEPGCSVHCVSSGKSPGLPCLNVLICHPQNGGDNSSAYLTGLWWGSNELTSLTRLEWSQVHRFTGLLLWAGSATHSPWFPGA